MSTSKFEDMVLRKIFGSKGEGATGDWRKLCNEDLHGLCSFQYISGVGRDGRGMWEDHNIYRVLVGKPEGKRLPGIFRRRWEDDVKMGTNT
jgi:hypothetical protein